MNQFRICAGLAARSGKRSAIPIFNATYVWKRLLLRRSAFHEDMAPSLNLWRNAPLFQPRVVHSKLFLEWWRCLWLRCYFEKHSMRPSNISSKSPSLHKIAKPTFQYTVVIHSTENLDTKDCIKSHKENEKRCYILNLLTRSPVNNIRVRKSVKQGKVLIETLKNGSELLMT